MMNSRVILCRHEDFEHLKIEVDFGELWEGAPNQKSRSTAYNWGGGFRGRPLLADQIMPTIRSITQSEKRRALTNLLSNFRKFFRFLDAYERWADSQKNNIFPVRVDGLEAITVHHLQLWKTPSPGGEWQQVNWNSYIRVTQCLREATVRLGLPTMIVPAMSRPLNSSQKENPGEVSGKLLVKLLAKEASAIFAHWERADQLAESGRNLIGMVRSPNSTKNTTTLYAEGGIGEADLHTTYRAAVAENNNLPLNRIQFLAVLGYGTGKREHPTPSWWPIYDDGPNAGNAVQSIDLQSGLYPTAEQLLVLFLLFLARTGWNPSTAETLDITEDASWCKEYTEKFVWLFAYKPRSQDWQDTVSTKKQRTGAYQIIRRLLARTENLRRAMHKNPSLCSNYKIGQRSPWLYQRTNQHDDKAIRAGISETETRRVLKNLIVSHNARKENSAKQIPESLCPSDLRDIFAAATFVNSNFSLFMTQMALGHKKSATVFNYLRRRAWRAESEQKKNALFVALIDQIETHRVIDLTLLRATMDGINVTQAMIDRLETYRRYRTYSGTGCSDPKHPPVYVDPGNPRDGTTPCAQGHLCAGCPKGRVFNDSLPLLARRQAELEWLRDTLPLEVFQDSSLADQLLVLTATLKQWPTKEVAKHVAHWLEQIVAGTHRPVRFSGEH